jgi:hypothetical protein
MSNLSKLLSGLLGAIATVFLILGVLAMPGVTLADDGAGLAPAAFGRCLPANCNQACDSAPKIDCTSPYFPCIKLGTVNTPCDQCYCNDRNVGSNFCQCSYPGT